MEIKVILEHFVKTDAQKVVMTTELAGKEFEVKAYRVVDMIRVDLKPTGQAIGGVDANSK